MGVFVLISVAFFFGALNTLKQDSMAAEEIDRDARIVAKTIFVVSPDAMTLETGDRSSRPEPMTSDLRALMHTVSPCDVEAIFAGGSRSAQCAARLIAKSWDIPVHSFDEDDLHSFASAVLASRHQVVVAAESGDRIPELLQELGVRDLPSASTEDLFIVSIDPTEESRLLHLKYGLRSL
jgi:hypothetical protein